MEKCRLNDDERNTVVNALTEKAMDDQKRAEELAAGADQSEMTRRLALTFRHQAAGERALVEKIENFDTIELS